MQSLAVIGSGTMGSGIAQVAAASGFNVILCDVQEAFLEKALKAITSSYDKFVQKDKMSDGDRQAALARLKTTTRLEEVAGVDLVVEAITEQIEAKRVLFAKLEDICKKETIFASNTSSLSVTEMSQASKRADQVVGMHFFNPPALMKLVEVVRTPLTSQATFEAVWQVALKMGKTPVETRDTPGFIFNRLIIPYLNEAMWALYEGAGKVADIDAAMKLGGNMPIGPLALLDLIGIDVQLHACSAFLDQFGDPKFRPCPLNRAMVRAGLLGKKTGKGFYDYSQDPPQPVSMDPFRL
ncbi:MAG: 3-hydroxyacyl-CoA dehydrogenase NAD-binding domain-containing protein [Vulcanimicrobiota bacterium]